jgi:hypothetical protein
VFTILIKALEEIGLVFDVGVDGVVTLAQWAV